MSVATIEPGESLGAEREGVVVCIPLYGGHELFLQCLRSVLAHTPADVPLLVCDDASPDERSWTFLAELSLPEGAERVRAFRQHQNVGFPANVNDALRSAAPADIVVLNSDCVVGEGWLEGLRAAAYSDSRLATSTALSNHGSVVSVPDGKPRRGLPEGWTLDSAAAAVRHSSLRIRPRLPTAIGHCMYIRRSAVELVGEFDLAFTPGYGEEVDFSQRCLQMGLAHVLADDVFVLHYGGGSFASVGAPATHQQEHERLLARRYPYYHQAVRELYEDPSGPLHRALGSARRALRGLHVCIDARVLAGPMTGSQRHVLELLAGLARSGQAHVSAIVPERMDPWVHDALGSLADARLLTRRAAEARLRDGESALADVVHRPFQIHHEEDLSFLAGLGPRLVITNQDLIGYQNPAYFRDAEAWHGYRRTTRTALAVADRVVFFSRHALAEAMTEDLVEPARASVVHIGVDHQLCADVQTVSIPAGVEGLPENAEAILCLGTDFNHKNRLFALRIAAQLQRAHDWQGYLLLAGPRVAQGSSAALERELLSGEERLARRVIDLGPVSEAEKNWLYRRAGLTLYPTVYEGFGLVPFESGEHSVPCLWAQGTSLGEVLPDGAAQIIPWDVDQSAERALAMLRDPAARERNLAAIRGAAGRLTWEASAAALLALYRITCDTPASPASAVSRRDGAMSGMLSEDAMHLLGPGGAIPDDVARPLLALATHRPLAAPMFGAIKLGYRASYVLRRRRGPGGDRRA